MCHLLSRSSLAMYRFSKLLLTSAISHGKKLVSISENQKQKSFDKCPNIHIKTVEMTLSVPWDTPFLHTVHWTCYVLMLRKTFKWNRGGWMANLWPLGHRSSRGFSVSWRLLVGGQPSTAGCTPGQQSSLQSLFLSSTPPSAGQFCAPEVRRNFFLKKKKIKEKKKHNRTNRHCGASVFYWQEVYEKPSFFFFHDSNGIDDEMKRKI